MTGLLRADIQPLDCSEMLDAPFPSWQFSVRSTCWGQARGTSSVPPCNPSPSGTWWRCSTSDSTSCWSSWWSPGSAPLWSWSRLQWSNWPRPRLHWPLSQAGAPCWVWCQLSRIMSRVTRVNTLSRWRCHAMKQSGYYHSPTDTVKKAKTMSASAWADSTWVWQWTGNSLTSARLWAGARACALWWAVR